ncbi:hypothetical protein SIO70_04280 [Chitinophaga sancti]|uniref:hypothetical protein n=1 Tax=Chitinophaga sancti TaxID=1004 RepID=UPI002A757E7B|nr:hypothetical protein [Chitinophaga sancti]WPQ64079.1 hypothetical protein SIO70_04280 [Chitinophaga sancti]
MQMQLISIQFFMLADLQRSGLWEACAQISTVGKSGSIGFDTPVGDDHKKNDSEREPEIYQRPSYIWT